MTAASPRSIQPSVKPETEIKEKPVKTISRLVQWGSEIRPTCPDFEWWKEGWFTNGI